MDVRVYSPGDFEQENHFYSKVLNAQVHPTVKSFLGMNTERMVARYCHLHPDVEHSKLEAVLTYVPHHMPWSGADLFYVATPAGNRRMVVIETNSCPSGQKSMPVLDDWDDEGGYKRLLETSFFPRLEKTDTIDGKLAVIYDKNSMEASGYAACMAELSGEEVLLAPHKKSELDSPVRFEEGTMQIYHEEKWQPIRGAFRYVTQSPWDRIPIESKTFIFNPIIACLAGGRNKLVASKAYELYNASLAQTGLKILTPVTKRDISLMEVPTWVQRFQGYAVVKNPYSNAGQGVFTITSKEELEHFMNLNHHYDNFIVQSLVGNSSWSSRTSDGALHHIGTVPNKKGNIFVADLRFMLGATPKGYRPIAMYARRTRVPLSKEAPTGDASWDMLGTNLSVKLGPDTWDSDTSRLLIMDRKDFTQLGIGLDDLIEGYIQTVLSSIAIDKMARKLIHPDGSFNRELYMSFDRDETLNREIVS